MKKRERICTDANCGNHNGRYKNKCRALSFVPAGDYCFAKMSQEEAEETDNIIDEAMAQEVMKQNKTYYEKHRNKS